MSNRPIQTSMRRRRAGAPGGRGDIAERTRRLARSRERPWPPDPADYAYTAELSPFGWAWEFLRRNPAFRRATAASRASQGERAGEIWSGDAREDDVQWLVLHQSEPVALTWGLDHVPDPDANGVNASVIWSADAIGGDLEAFLQLDHDDGAERLRLEDIPGRKAVLVRPGAHLRVVVEAAGYGEVLSAAAPESALPHDLALALGVGDWATVDAHLARLTAFAAFCREPAGACSPSRRRAARRLADTLVALDGWLAGRSYREIAHAFHDPLEIEDDWRGPGAIKLRMRRRVAAGVALMRGGYRRLLTTRRRRRLR